MAVRVPSGSAREYKNTIIHTINFHTVPHGCLRTIDRPYPMAAGPRISHCQTSLLTITIASVLHHPYFDPRAPCIDSSSLVPSASLEEKHHFHTDLSQKLYSLSPTRLRRAPADSQRAPVDQSQQTLYGSLASGWQKREVRETDAS